MRNKFQCVWVFCLIVSLLLGNFIVPQIGYASQNRQLNAEDKARALMDQMRPEEKVGQLLLVTFNGTDAGSGSIIHDLITRYHIGGVVLKRENDNFIGPENTIQSAWELITQLQIDEWEASQIDVQAPISGEFFTPQYTPLLISISQEGDGYPYSELLSGMTPLPNQMTLGATWNPSFAEQIGIILGDELSRIGINLLIGPSLDILEDPSPDDTGNLGTRTFGGDPFWVGELGKAYIRGVHNGSQDRIMLVGKYFPGRGSSDRPPEEEVATIRKTLEQLKQTDLAPFFAVTGNAPDELSTIDGLLTSHIKYQGFQTNIRSTTRPISFDPQAFNQLMSLPEFSIWRENGGVMVSDDLGTRAVSRFFSPSGEVFNARFVARDALLAGNDLLYMGDLVSSDDPDSFTTIKRTAEFFTEKYNEDPAFALRVDDAVERILVKKFEIYPDFQLPAVLTPETALENIGSPNQVLFEIARSAATLISPNPEELDNVLPNPPGLQERIVFITDAYSLQQCSLCPEQPVLRTETLQDAVLRLYGPESGAQTTRRNMLSFSFENLQSMLDRGINRTEIEFHIKNAQWIVIAMLDVRSQRQLSTQVKRFLNERPDLLRDKNVIVFALNAPYFLDATDISKLTAYYGLFSKTPQSIEVAARLLFNEIRPLNGALPVSVSGIGYDLFTATTPNPNQQITLFLDQPTQPNSESSTTTTPSPSTEYRVGDLVPVRTGIILDHNNNPVPDDTEVRFYLSTVGERSVIQREIVANTGAGVARAVFPIETQGNLAITARSDPATLSDTISITTAGERPTETPTQTSEPSPTLTPTDEPPMTIGEIPILPPDPEGNQGKLLNWILAIALGLIVSWLAYRASITMGLVRWSMRIGLCVMIGGLLVYTYTAFGFPGGSWLLENAGMLAGSIATIIGNGIGFVAAIMWKNGTQ